MIESALPPIPSSTVLLLRDSLEGLEVFMIKRNIGIDFAGGALVYPGGKFDPADLTEETAAYCDGIEGLDMTDIGYRVCGIRETFEEAGFLLAREKGDDALIDGERCAVLGAAYRDAVHAGEMTIKDVAEKERLTLACDQIVPFAHWITPSQFPKRYGTWFFLAAAPHGQIGFHDNKESVDSLWINPQKALARARDKIYKIVFATRMNLHKVGRSDTVESALAAARADKIVPVEPIVTHVTGGVSFTIPLEAGYGIDQETETDGSTKLPKP